MLIKLRIPPHVFRSTALTLVLCSLAASAQNTINVCIDPSSPWNGYETVNKQDNSFWRGDYFPPADAHVFQGTISSSGMVVCAPDIRMDRDFPYDTDAWADDSGTSEGICRVVSTFYIDSTTTAVQSDTVVFTGTFVTNGLMEPCYSTAIAFIKDFDSNFGWHGMASVPLSNLANGEQFTVTKPLKPADPAITFNGALNGLVHLRGQTMSPVWVTSFAPVIQSSPRARRFFQSVRSQRTSRWVRMRRSLRPPQATASRING